jgi:hypothetical protein
MPVLYLNQIPRNAGEHFGSTFVHGYVVFDPDSTNSWHVNTGLDGYHVPRLQNPLLPLREAGIFVDFQPKPMSGAMHEVLVQRLPCQDFSGSGIHFPTGRAGHYGFYGCRLGTLHGSMPHANFLGRPPHYHCPRNVAAIVREYNTQVQHDQFIFPQSFGGGSSMRVGGALTKGDDRFKGWA